MVVFTVHLAVGG